MYPVAAANDFMFAANDYMLVGYAYDLAFIRVELHLPMQFPDLLSSYM